jgi:hypothetical protein
MRVSADSLRTPWAPEASRPVVRPGNELRHGAGTIAAAWRGTTPARKRDDPGRILLHVTERQQFVARQLARGYSQRYISRTTGVSRDTIRRWLKDPAFADFVEGTRAQLKGSTALGTLIDALGARKDDGVDWSNRVRAAIVLLGIEDPADEPLNDEIGWHPA